MNQTAHICQTVLEWVKSNAIPTRDVPCCRRHFGKFFSFPKKPLLASCVAMGMISGTISFAQGPVTSLCFTAFSRQDDGIALTISCPTNWWKNRSAVFDVFCKEGLEDAKWFCVGEAYKSPSTSIVEFLVPYEVLPVWSIEMPSGSTNAPYCMTNVVLSASRFEAVSDYAAPVYRTYLPGVLQTNFVYVCQGPRQVKERYFFTAARDWDSDGDGIPDPFEMLQFGTDPDNEDSDGDGLDDCWEWDNLLDPADATGINGSSGDPDGDGMTNLQEYSLYTAPCMLDTDLDGMPDGWEVNHGLNPRSKWDANYDPDVDGLANLAEFLLETDPTEPCLLDAGNLLRFDIRTPMP